MRLPFLYVLFVAALSSLPAVAQQPDRTVISVGATVGVGIFLTPINPSSVRLEDDLYIRTNAKNSGGAMESSSCALFVRIARKYWFVQPEAGSQGLMSSTMSYNLPPPRGWKTIGPQDRNKDYNFDINQISLGVMTGFYIGPHHHLYFLAGPSLAFRVGRDDFRRIPPSHRIDDYYTYDKEIQHSLNHAPESTRYFINGGLGYWGNRFTLEGRIAYGLTPLVRSLTFQGQDYALKAQGHLLLLNAGFFLNLKKKAPILQP